MDEFQNTTMRRAFIDANVMRPVNSVLVARVVSALKRGVGRAKRQRWWAVIR